MKNQKLFIVLTDDDKEEHVLFKEVVSEYPQIDFRNSFEKGDDLIKYLFDASVQKPNLLFLDLNMPSKSGFDCLNEIRATGNLDDLRVIVYSTSCAVRDIERTYNYGADLYVTKPNDFFQMKKMLDLVVAINWESFLKNRTLETFKLEF